MDIAEIRQEYPLLEKTANKRKLIYLDNAATTQMPDCVLNAFVRHYQTTNANVHRAMHFLGEASTAMVERVRAKTAEFIGAESSRNIIFTAGTTASVILAAGSYAMPRLKKGDTIVSTVMEHHSNYLPWYSLCERKECRLMITGLTSEGELDLRELEIFLEKRPVICTVTYCSNVTGAVNPVKRIVEMSHRKGVPVFVDAAQYMRDGIINVQELGVDFLCFSAHKMMGPSGLGVLYASDEMLEKMQPVFTGGGTIYDIKNGIPQYEDAPACFEAGTVNVGAIAAFGETLDYLERIGRQKISEREKKLTRILRNRLVKIPEVTILGPSSGNYGSCISITVKDMHFYDIAVLMDKQGVAVRSGNHCAVPLHQAYGIAGSLRFSPAFYNTEEEIIKAADAFDRAVGLIKEYT